MSVMRLGVLRRMAEAGSRDAQFHVGRAYMYGTGGIASDIEEAVKWFRLAARQGHTMAKSEAGYLLYWRLDEPEEGLKWIEEAAREGFSLAEANYGAVLLWGLHTPSRPREGIRWIEKAVARKDPYAFKILSEAYAAGRGVKRDPVKALEMLTRSAETGDESAISALACVYMKGRAPNSRVKAERDPAEAVKWMKRGAAAGLPDSQMLLAGAYLTGAGVEKDTAEALRLFRLLAEKGHPGAFYNMGLMYQNGDGVERDHAEAAECFRKAISAAAPGGLHTHYGDFVVRASLQLGVCYLNGMGVEKDEARGFELMKKAAKGGNPMAMRNLALLYEDGIGTDRNPGRARYWREKAAAKRGK
jgi:TPR repeat protein